MASKPEPAPVNRGVEVTPLLLKWLKDHGYSDKLVKLIEARRLYGIAKYGQGLMSDDGRDTMEDARQEAADLLQYLTKALYQIRPGPSREELNFIEEILRACAAIIAELKRSDPGFEVPDGPD